MEKNLTIDRMELADTGQAAKLAQLVIDQIQPQLEKLLPIPIEKVAEACGITRIHEFIEEGFEGGLIQDPEKTKGIIMVKAGSRMDRRRFTIGHELGHFLNPYHLAPEGMAQLLCTSQHMRVQGKTNDPRLSIEVQANEFAANLLMPPKVLRKNAKLWGSPQLQAILDIQELCFVSKEAAARCFLEMHGDPCAVVFSFEGKVRYAISRGGLPNVEVKRDQPVPRKTLTKTFAGEPGTISEQEEVDPFLWLPDAEAKKWNMWEEVLVQEKGYRMTLLVAEGSTSEEDEELEERWRARLR